LQRNDDIFSGFIKSVCVCVSGMQKRKFKKKEFTLLIEQKQIQRKGANKEIGGGERENF